MNTSQPSTGELVAGLGGLLLIVSLFLDWVSGQSIQLGPTTISSSGSAWDVFSGMDIIMLLVGIAAIGFAAASAFGAGANLPPGSSLVVSLLGVGVLGWALGWDLENSSAGFGSWLALVAAGAIAYGAHAVNAPSLRSPRRVRDATPPSPSQPMGSSAEPGASRPGSTPPPR